MDCWDSLTRELDCWADENKQASMWWRDDDACVMTPQLKQLVGIASSAKVPLHLAVIPARLTAETAKLINSSDNCFVLQHGFAHTDYAPKGRGSWELGLHRPMSDVLAELSKGQQILQTAFADKFFPIVVPPWNRIDERVVEQLPKLGFDGVSGEGEQLKNNDSNVKVINCHCDPIKWKENARFKGEEKVLDCIVSHLQHRRESWRESWREDHCDPCEPTGLCTHHMDHSAELWKFISTLFEHTNQHRAARWIRIDIVHDRVGLKQSNP